MRRDLSKGWKGEEKISWERFQAEEEAKNEGTKVSKTVKRVRSDGTREMKFYNSKAEKKDEKVSYFCSFFGKKETNALFLHK